MERVIILVDAFSTGRLLPTYFRKLAPECILAHIQSSITVPDELLRGFQPSDFDFAFGVFDSLEAITASLGTRRVIHVIPGSEPGVELAHALAKNLQCASRNLDVLAEARRDKIKMQAAASEKVATAFTAGISSLGQAEEYLREGTIRYPVVVKPPMSAGTDMVSICKDISELASALDLILGRRDKLGNYVTEAVFQEFLDGEEYCLSAVAVDANYFFTDVWKYRKRDRDGSRIYEYDELIEPTRCPGLLTYAANVLESLGVQTGPAHLEIIRTSYGYRLVEVGSRLQGGVHLDSLIDALDANPIELAAAAYVRPDIIKRQNWSNSEARTLSPRKNLLCVHLIAQNEGQFDIGKASDLLKGLDSFFPGSFVPEVPANSHVRRTTDLFSSPGFCYLVSDSPSAVWNDYQMLRQLESSHFYR